MNVHEAIENRRSVRDYDPRPIPEETTQKLLNALRYSPSACNFQPRRFVLITDSEQRGRIVNACNNHSRITRKMNHADEDNLFVTYTVIRHSTTDL